MAGATKPVRPEAPKLSAADRLDSWKEISAYLKRSVRTVHRWESEEALPVHRHLHQSSGTVYAFKSELDTWWASRKTQLEAIAEPPDEALQTASRRRSASALTRWLIVQGVIVVVAAMATLAYRHKGVLANPTIRSLAVLPLQNLTGDPAQEYFADSMTDALITQLAQVGELRVISRTSVVRYKDAKTPLQTIAQELNVDGVVEGTVVRSGPRVRIDAQLIDARNDRHLWARSYERDLNDIMALQGEVAQAIAEAVVKKLSPKERARLAGSRPVDPEANHLLYQGLVAASRQSYEGFSDAITYFEKAIAKQPDSAGAYSGLSLCYIQFSFVGPLAPEEFMPKAEGAARKALELDEGLAEPHAVLGIILYRYHWNWSAAETELRRALDLSPNYAEGHRMLAAFLVASGRSEEALAEAQHARELDPLSLQALLNLAAASRAAGHYDQAVEEYREALQKDPQRPRAHYQLGVTYVETGDLNEGLAELQAAAGLSQGNPHFLAYLGYADAVSGKRREAQEILNKLDNLSRQQYVTPFGIATIHMGLGEKEKALAWLERAYQAHDSELVGITTDHRLDPLHSDTHFRDLVRRVGLAR